MFASLECILQKQLTYLQWVKVTSKLAALKGLDARLREIRGYLDRVIDGNLPLNHEILYHLQVGFSRLLFLLIRFTAGF